MTWHLNGTFFESCNCEVVCPCIFLSPPSRGEYTALVGWHIDDGNDEGVDLSRLNVALAVNSPGHMATTEWKVAVYVDERASEAQNASLMKIFGGQGGGHPARLATHIGEIVGVRSTAINYAADGNKVSLSIPDIADVEIEQVNGQGDGPITVSGHPLCIAPGYAATAAKSTKNTFSDQGMSWDMTEKSGHFRPLPIKANNDDTVSDIDHERRLVGAGGHDAGDADCDRDRGLGLSGRNDRGHVHNPRHVGDDDAPERVGSCPDWRIVRDVGCDDGCNDVANSVANDFGVCAYAGCGPQQWCGLAAGADVFGRLCRRLGWFQYRSGGFAGWVCQPVGDVADDDEACTRTDRGGRVDCRRGLPVYAAEAFLSAPVSHTAELSDDPVARRWLGRVAHGWSARSILCWLLLGADGIVVCGRRHEHGLDRRDYAIRVDREDRAER